MIINSQITKKTSGGEELPKISYGFRGSSASNAYLASENGDELAELNSTYWFGKMRKNGANLSINLSTASKWRICLKVKVHALSTGGGSLVFFSNDSNIYKSPSPELSKDGQWWGVGFNTGSGTSSWSNWISVSASNMPLDTWYYLVVSWHNGKGGLFLYDNNGNLIDSGFVSVGAWGNHTFTPVLGGAQTSYWWHIHQGDISLSETFIQIDDNYVWGQANSKTQNMGLITN